MFKTMKKTFESFKKFISEKGKQANACTSEYNRVLESKDYADLLQVIKDNYNWCFNNSIFTKEELISLVPNDVLLDNGFYYDYSGELLNDKTAFVFDSTIQDVWDNATIQHVRDNGKYFKYEYGNKPKLFMKKDAFDIVEL